MRDIKRNLKIVCGVVAVVSCLACGGGGGGSSVANYSGTWDISAVRVVNDCGIAVGSTFFNTIVVNQDQSRIVVNSGSRVLQGEINDRDGFTVRDVLQVSSGCTGAAAYSFGDASDGEADVGVALVVRCGVRECTVGYGGTGTRRAQRMAPKYAAPKTDLNLISRALEDSVASGGGESGQGTAAESAENLADLVAPAS